MTLIVAQKTKESIYVVGDTKITYGYKKTEPLDGVVKSIIINPNLCISFAGTVSYAEEAIKKYKENNKNPLQNNIGKIVQHFLQHHLECKQETDFIIAVRDREMKLYRIYQGLSEDVDVAWIGDKDAFECYQKFKLDKADRKIPEGYFRSRISFQSEYNKPENDIYNSMLDAMSSVIEDSSIKSVGQFYIPVIYDYKKFRYAPYADTFTQYIPPAERIDSFFLPAGSAENGSYSISLTDYEKKNTRIIVIYILEGKIGVVYKTEDNGIMKPIFYKNIELKKFRDSVKQDLGFDIGTFFDSDIKQNGAKVIAYNDLSTGKVSLFDF